jgi:chromate reductase, NAD(P)H dehydrogenase (quinone)
MSKVLIITASEGKNLQLAEQFQERLQLLGEDSKILRLVELNLPLYTSKIDSDFDAKGLLGSWWDELLDARSFIFLTPEYNGGPSPVLTNFIAWVSRASKNWREAFNGKPAVIGSFSGGGGHHALFALRSQLSYLGINVLGRQLIANSTRPVELETLKVLSQELLQLTKL